MPSCSIQALVFYSATSLHSSDYLPGAGTNGDDLLCMGINTEPAAEEVMVEPVEQAFVQGGTLKLNWSDCGAKHGKVTGLSPTTLALGQETAVIGSGNVDEAVTGGKFSLEVNMLSY